MDEKYKKKVPLTSKFILPSESPKHNKSVKDVDSNVILIIAGSLIV